MPLKAPLTPLHHHGIHSFELHFSEVGHRRQQNKVAGTKAFLSDSNPALNHIIIIIIIVVVVAIITVDSALQPQIRDIWIFTIIDGLELCV